MTTYCILESCHFSLVNMAKMSFTCFQFGFIIFFSLLIPLTFFHMTVKIKMWLILINCDKDNHMQCKNFIFLNFKSYALTNSVINIICDYLFQNWVESIMFWPTCKSISEVNNIKKIISPELTKSKKINDIFCYILFIPTIDSAWSIFLLLGAIRMQMSKSIICLLDVLEVPCQVGVAGQLKNFISMNGRLNCGHSVVYLVLSFLILDFI